MAFFNSKLLVYQAGYLWIIRILHFFPVRIRSIPSGALEQTTSPHDLHLQQLLHLTFLRFSWGKTKDQLEIPLKWKFYEVLMRNSSRKAGYTLWQFNIAMENCHL